MAAPSVGILVRTRLIRRHIQPPPPPLPHPLSNILLPPLPPPPPSRPSYRRRNICRGLFERHKLLFSALICFQILRHRGEIPREEWALFLRGAGPVDRASQPLNPNPVRFTPVQWDLLHATQQRAVAPSLSSGNKPGGAGGDDGDGGEGREAEVGGRGGGNGSPPPLEGLCESIGGEWSEWVSWADGGDVWDANRIPGNFFSDGVAGGGSGSGGRGRGTAFQRLLLVKAFREDQLLRCIGKFVGEKLGSTFADRWAGQSLHRPVGRDAASLLFLVGRRVAEMHIQRIQHIHQLQRLRFTSAPPFYIRVRSDSKKPSNQRYRLPAKAA